MTLNDLTTIEQLERLLEGAGVCRHKVLDSKDGRYQWVRKALVQFSYLTLGKREMGVVFRANCNAKSIPLKYAITKKRCTFPDYSEAPPHQTGYC